MGSSGSSLVKKIPSCYTFHVLECEFLVCNFTIVTPYNLLKSETPLLFPESAESAVLKNVERQV